MAIVAYSKYRLLVSKISSGTAPGYVTINEFGLYESASHSGANLCTGATATAHSSYDATNTPPSKAIDGNATTFWESGNLAATPKWLQIDLASAKEVRSIYISSTTYPNEVPRDFVLQGSNDGTTWTAIATFADWVTSTVAKSAYEQINIRVGGVSQLDSGTKTSKILIFDWATGALIASVIPETSGAWSYAPRLASDLLITHIGPSGFQPWSDGPVTPNLE